ncbi:MAG: chemotaxis protein CheB [Dehalogenimonas sp.]
MQKSTLKVLISGKSRMRLPFDSDGRRAMATEKKTARKESRPIASKSSEKDPVTPMEEESAKSPAAEKPAHARHSRTDFPIVGIGASAGGLDAFSKFLSATPNDTGMAFVLIQHLDPTHASNMVDLLKRYTKMPVHEATDEVKLEPDHVYMIPPNRNMTISEHNLRLLQQIERPGISHSIDLFFKSQASDLKEKAIAIIMSGTGTDGSLGAKAVKAEGGMIIVQDPETAGYDGMPRSAIASGVADFVLPAEQMTGKLIDYVDKSFGKRMMRQKEVETDSTTLANILSLIRARTKHDFSGYKQSTINRRIERRMGINQIDNIPQYLRVLREKPSEVDALVKDFLINVTSFFRDPEAFTALKEQLKVLFNSKPEGSEIRAWIPGCSTGEEAYSIVIVMDEVLEELKKYFVVQVFGTDLDPDAIGAARTGIYPTSISPDVGDERLKRYFSKTDDQFQIKRELREKLVFAVQDIITDPPFTRMDLISARNLLIYFDADLQKRLIPMFHYSLNYNGLLFLGTAETVGEFAELFEPVDRKWKIYKTQIKDKHLPFPLQMRREWKDPLGVKIEGDSITTSGLKARTPEQVLLEALPPAVLLDSNQQVIFTHGDTRRFIGFPEGRPNLDILEIVHPEIRSALSGALREATTNNRIAVNEGAQVKVNGDTKLVKITVMPVIPVGMAEQGGRYIITFQDLPKMKRFKGRGSEENDGRVSQLEQELQYNKETLRSTIEELETANEELRSANEEYQSTNEELQSTNEELETSREELQSVNEELSTVNAEHQAKIEELSTVNDDMKNLLNSTGVATIYLDNDLKVKRFTPTATHIFNLIAGDVNRPISHITSQMGDYNIAAKAQKVLDTLIPVQESLESKDHHWYSMRILPYRTTDNSIAGVVVTFIDVSEQERLKVALSYAESITDTLFQPTLVLDADMRIVTANMAFQEAFKTSRLDAEGKGLFEIGQGEWNIPELKKVIEGLIETGREVRGNSFEIDFKLIGHRKLCLNARTLNEKGEPRRFLLGIEDITEPRKEGCV